MKRSIDPCILVFIKAPSPGQVKTRLGKFIGNREAAQLYQYFVEDVLTNIDTLKVDSLIFFTPANGLSMLQSWLGLHRTYIPQQGDSLGDRMAHAFRTSFELGYQQVSIVGSDSPDLPSSYLLEALEALQQDNVVIGPSEDGGYYTLGFTPTTFCPEVFQDMPWSTDRVYPLTLQTLNHNARNVRVLPTWSDIDTLDDLWAFHNRHLIDQPFSQSLSYLRDRAHVFFHHFIEAQNIAPFQSKPDSTKTPDLSIVIPVLYEAERIQTCLENLLQLAGDIHLEVIVVDGDPEGSTLNYIPSQYPYSLKRIQSPKGRGTQMNAGAQIAQGKILLFLHVDTALPNEAFQLMIRTCQQSSCAGGAFDLAIASPRWSLKLIGKVASWRSRFTRIPYGDQAIFILKDIFEQVQGYPDIPLMEDVALMQRLKQQRHPIKILSNPVKVSSRRWEKEGILRCTLRNWSLILLYSLGISPKTLARWYQPTPRSTPPLTPPLESQ